MGDGNDKLRYGYEASHVDLVDYRHLGCSSADGNVETFLVGHDAQIPGLISQDITLLKM